MKRCFVQCAEVTLEPDADSAAPGGAVTIALCGNWDHAGACRWPHQTSGVRVDQLEMVRVIFVADEEDEEHVRALIAGALSDGECVGPDGKLSHWEAAGHGKGVVSESEEAWGAGLGGSTGSE